MHRIPERGSDRGKEMPKPSASSRELQLLFLFLAPLLPCSAYTQGNDVAALKGFQKGVKLDPSGSLLTTWNEKNVDATGCPSGWYGVSCSNGRVTILNLSGLNLSGKIPENTLGFLSELSSLLLSSNSFSGTLPADLGTLPNLQELDLSDNHFNGAIPSTFASLQSLVNLTLARNELSGSLPDIFQNLTSLRLLDLSTNGLSEMIPETLTHLLQLSTLNLSWNQISGMLPPTLGTLQQLKILDLSHNKFSDIISPDLVNLLSNLVYVDLSSNDLSGQLPWQEILTTSFNILYVNLSHNRLTGSLTPPNAATPFADNLQKLDLSSNQLSGELPSFQYVSALMVLKLQNNSFFGAVPFELLAADSYTLQEIDISMNKLSGSLSSITATNLQLLNLSSNLLSGSLPMRLGSCRIVDLSSNQFSGDLSGMKTWSDSLEYLDLSHNSLNGSLPVQTAQLLRLSFLNISHNGLSSSIPYSFGFYQKLTVLDLTANQLTGSIPTSLFHSNSLNDLRLAQNSLSGNIVLDSGYSADSTPFQQTAPLSSLTPAASVMYSPLVFLDLSSNDLNGPIPPDITLFPSLQVLDLSRNKLMGTIARLFNQLTDLKSLDLSFNELMGNIPSDLPASLQHLNVSYNHFSGTIPQNLEQKFPRSSFFPGNSDLIIPAGSPNNGPGFPGMKRKRNGAALKAGLVGGCIALALLICLAGSYIVISRHQKKRRTPDFLVMNKEFERRSGEATSRKRHEYSPPVDISSTSGSSMTFSREQLLSPENGTSSEPKVVDKAGKFILAGSSPFKKVSTSHIPTLRQDESSSSSSSSSAQPRATLQVRSPDNLAGDLYLVDNNINFTADELSRAPAEVLGRSNLGTSYKASLDNGHVLMVKWLREGLVKSKKDFTKEARKYSNIRHPNLVQMRGYYWGPREHEKLIISDYFSSGSLAGRLSERAGRNFSPLTSLQRLHIAVDAARGLTYLHAVHHLPHGNLKAANILLNGPAFDGHVSDYGLHRLMTGSGIANLITSAGALGYRAPELANVRMPKPSLKADVYAFGVILLELFTGKGAGDIIPESSGTVDLPDWVRLQVNNGCSLDCFDRNLGNLEGNTQHSRALLRALEIALRCLSPSSTRPNMKKVYEELSGIDP